MPSSRFHEKRRKQFLKEKERFEERWGWLAHLLAATGTTLLRAVYSYLSFCFGMLSIGPKGFALLVLLHILALVFLATGL